MTRYLTQLVYAAVRIYTAYTVFYNQHNEDNGIIREQQGNSEGHFCVSLHCGAAALTNTVKTEVASAREPNHRTMIQNSIINDRDTITKVGTSSERKSDRRIDDLEIGSSECR